MIINRIIIDTLEWLKTIFWHNEELQYKIISIEDHSSYRLVELKRDTKRSLLFYLYEPKYEVINCLDSEKEYEYYICLDHLGDLAVSSNDKYLFKSGNTHSFSILKTKKWIKKTNIEAHIIVYTELNLRNKISDKSYDDLAIEIVKCSLKHLQNNFITEIKWPYLLNYIKIKLLKDFNSHSYIDINTADVENTKSNLQSV